MICSRDHVDVQEQRIFVKNASGGFVGLTPNQLQQMHMMADMVEPPQHLRGGGGNGNGNLLRLSGSSGMASSNHHCSNL